MRRVARLAAPLAAAAGLSLILSACGSSGGNFVSPATSTTETSGSTPPGGSSGPAQFGDQPSNAPAPQASQAAYTPTGNIIADDGYRPDKNGFGFPNYGTTGPDGSSAVTNLTVAQMQKLFGNTVCVDPSASKCTLAPEAKAWMDQTNNAMGGGHCYGFSAASLMFWKSQANPNDYGSSSTPQLNYQNNSALEGQIAYAWAYQVLPWVRGAQIKGTPVDILNALKTGLDPNSSETYTLTIFKRDGSGGHAITPYAIEDNGGGMFHILVYDNNYPGVTRAVTVDTNANTWTYNAAINPNEPSEKYDGDATTQSLGLWPTGPGLNPRSFTTSQPLNAQQSSAGTAGTFQLAAFTADNSSTSGVQDEVYLDGSDTNHSHLLITNSAGQSTGFENGKLVNNIPGADVENISSTQNWKNALEPIYYVPDGSQYTITVDGSALTQTDNGEDIGFISPTYDLEIDKLNVSPGEKDVISVSPDDTNVTFQSSKTEAPEFVFGQSTDAADYNMNIKTAADGAGGTYHLGIATNGQSLNLDTGKTSGNYAFDLERDDANGSVNYFSHEAIHLDSGDAVKIDYGNWDSSSATIPMSITKNGQTQTQQLSDQDSSNQPVPDPSASDDGGA